MDTCVSCEAEPKFSYQIGPGKFMLFCIPHIPGFLKRKGGALLLKPYSPEPTPTPSKTSKKKKAEPATEEPVVEETQEEVLVDEEVTPTEE
jgi:hypothetical protein